MCDEQKFIERGMIVGMDDTRNTVLGVINEMEATDYAKVVFVDDDGWQWHASK